MDPPIFTLALDGGEWPASHPFTLKGTAPSTHWIGGWVDLSAGLDAMKKSRLPLPGIEYRLFGRRARKLIAIPTDVPRLLGQR
jgi:hypothetical protein